jgi:hypothetical protein
MAQLRSELKLLKPFFLVFVAFAVAWVPYATVVVADVDDNFNQPIHAFLILICSTTSAINCYVYAASNKQFRAAYVKLLRIDRCCESVLSQIFLSAFEFAK